MVSLSERDGPRQSRMGRKDDTGMGICSYKGDQTLVQGRLKVRTGEARTPRRGEAGALEGRIEGVCD